MRSAFVAALSGTLQAQAGEVTDERLAALLARARDSWPAFNVDAERFAAHVAARLPADVPLQASLERLLAADLYLACACLAGDAAALAALGEIVSGEVAAGLAGIRGAKPDASDLAQQLFQRLVVAADRAPMLASYSGRGAIRGWLRISVVRDALRSKTKLDREVPLEDEALLGAAADDPELDLLKSHYRQHFREGFHAALAALTAEDRNLLRHHFIHGLAIDDLAALYGINRSTAARRLVKLRRSLALDTRARMTARLQLGEKDLDSLLRLIRSQLDLSLRDALATRRE